MRRCRSSRSRRASRSCSASRCRCAGTGSTASIVRPAARCCARTCASTRARRRTTRRSHADGGSVRCVRHGRVWHRASGRGQHARGGEIRAGRLRGAAAGRELEALERALEKPARPLVAIVAGSKVSTKLTVLESLLGKVDKLIVGGGIANTFLAATGVRWQVAATSRRCSMSRARLLDAGARARHARFRCRPTWWSRRNLPRPRTPTCGPSTKSRPDEMILDIGPDTAERLSSCCKSAGTIIWNGPVGSVRVRAVRRGHARHRPGDCAQQGILPGWRRRHAGGHREVRRRGRDFLHLHRRRRFPRVRGGQAAAGRRGARGTRDADHRLPETMVETNQDRGNRRSGDRRIGCLDGNDARRAGCRAAQRLARHGDDRARRAANGA